MAIKSGWVGRYFEDFAVGDVYQHPLGRTILESDNTWFTLLTMNTNQNHFNAVYASRSPYGRVIVNSGLTLALVLGISVTDVSQNAIANLGWESIKLPHPVFVGDTLWGESLVLETRPSRKYAYGGIVRFRTRGLNQDGKVCVSYNRTVLLYRRDAPHNKNVFPIAETPIEQEPNG